MLRRGGSVTIISYIKKEPNQSQNKQTNKKTGWKPKHGNPLNLQSTTKQKIHQQTNKQTNIMCKCDFNATTGIRTFPSSTLKISVCWLRGVFCLILESCHASDNKLPSVCLCPQSLKFSVTWTDTCHMTDLICYLSQFRLSQSVSAEINYYRDIIALCQKSRILTLL